MPDRNHLASKAMNTVEKIEVAAKTQAEAADPKGPKVLKASDMKLAKREFDVSAVEKAVADALSIAGRAKKVALAMGLTKSVREVDGESASIVPPSVVNALVKAGKMDREHANRVLAANRLLDSIDAL